MGGTLSAADARCDTCTGQLRELILTDAARKLNRRQSPSEWPTWDPLQRQAPACGVAALPSDLPRKPSAKWARDAVDVDCGNCPANLRAALLASVNSPEPFSSERQRCSAFLNALDARLADPRLGCPRPMVDALRAEMTRYDCMVWQKFRVGLIDEVTDADLHLLKGVLRPFSPELADIAGLMQEWKRLGVATGRLDVGVRLVAAAVGINSKAMRQNLTDLLRRTVDQHMADNVDSVEGWRRAFPVDAYLRRLAASSSAPAAPSAPAALRLLTWNVCWEFQLGQASKNMPTRGVKNCANGVCAANAARFVHARIQQDQLSVVCLQEMPHEAWTTTWLREAFPTRFATVFVCHGSCGGGAVAYDRDVWRETAAAYTATSCCKPTTGGAEGRVCLMVRLESRANPAVVVDVLSVNGFHADRDLRPHPLQRIATALYEREAKGGDVRYCVRADAVDDGGVLTIPEAAQHRVVAAGDWNTNTRDHPTMTMYGRELRRVGDAKDPTCCLKDDPNVEHRSPFDAVYTDLPDATHRHEVTEPTDDKNQRLLASDHRCVIVHLTLPK